jgi:hypothetical protein
MGMYVMVLAAYECAFKIGNLPAIKTLLKARIEGGANMGLITVEALVGRQSAVI